MELSEQKAKDIDDILSFSVNKGFIERFDVSYYQIKIRPDLEKSYIFHLAGLVNFYMKKYERNWVSLDNSKSFACNNNTKAFLESGGFQKIYEIEKKQELKEEVDYKLAQTSLRDYPWTKWMARIGFVIALCLAIIELIRFLQE